MTLYATLLSPVSIGPVRVRNRVISSSHQTGLVHDHLPTEDLVAYHRARAAGGVGAIFIEATAVHPTGLLTAHTIGGYLPAVVPAYRRLSEAVHDQGARVFVQLFHGGREQISSSPKPPAVAPSAVPSLRFKSEPRALTVAEIGELIDGYATSARHAAEGGLDGVEVSMAHGYLPSQFFSALSNRRSDAYGLEARTRFALEVMAAIREAGEGRLAVGARLSADELVPGGLGPRDCAEVADELHRAGLVDFVSLALGHSAYPRGSTWIAPPPPAPPDAIVDPAAAVRRSVPGLTLIATTRVVDLEDAERMVADSVCDLVGMTRAHIADPELIAKTTSGRRETVIECVGCNQACIGHYHAGVPIGCAVNPRTGRERTLSAPAPPRPTAPRPTAPRPAGRRVLVIGAGPAGAAAALEAAEAGDAVTLVEREPEIGGQLRLAGLAPAHRELWERYRRSTLARLRAAAVGLEFGVVADAELAADFDLVVLATGARPFRPELPEAPPVAVRDAWGAIRAPADVSGPALVADWGGGWDGLDAAEQLAGAGVPVTLACAATIPGETLHQYQRNLYLARLDELGVAILHHAELSVQGGELRLRNVFSGRSEPLPETATLVLAQGRVPADELWSELEQHAGAIRAGDVLGPRTLEEAVLEGTLAVRPGAGAERARHPDLAVS
jgi:2,4-dienoyl-CoA reductase-like NADH-dependent reductase (Old Yellow Enzyme family)/thioredoxin reductase